MGISELIHGLPLWHISKIILTLFQLRFQWIITMDSLLLYSFRLLSGMGTELAKGFRFTNRCYNLLEYCYKIRVCYTFNLLAG